MNQDAALRLHRPLVRRIARRVVARVPANIEIDDLIQVGMLGLWEALQRFDLSVGENFEAYATKRIHGAMLDELREFDTLSKDQRKLRKDIDAALSRLQQRLGRAPAGSEVAKEAGLSLEKYHELLDAACATRPMSVADMLGDDGDGDFLERNAVDVDADPLRGFCELRRREALIAAIAKLPERERYVLTAHYELDLSLKAIGELMNVCESRVWRIHGDAIARLRLRLRAH